MNSSDGMDDGRRINGSIKEPIRDPFAMVRVTKYYTVIVKFYCRRPLCCYPYTKQTFIDIEAFFVFFFTIVTSNQQGNGFTGRPKV